MKSNNTTITFEKSKKIQDEAKIMFKFASENNCEEMIKLFLRIGICDINILNEALVKAIKENNKEITKLLLEKGADPNVNDGECLLIAVCYNHLEILDLLIEYKADLNVREKQAFVIALEEGYNEIFLKLVRASENVDFLSNSPLLKSIVSMNDISILEYLIKEKKIEINQETKNIMLLTASKLNKVEFIKYLTKIGADVEHNNNECIKKVCYRGNLEAMKALIEAGAYARVDNDSLICEAAKEGYFDIVALLIKVGLSPNANNGEPLRNAIMYSHKDIADLLRISMKMSVNEETTHRIMNMPLKLN